MQQTERYQLNQWELTDRIQMEDFNHDNAKIDAALGALAEEVTEKADLADLPWVKLWEGTLTKSAPQMDVTVPNVEQYAFLFLLFDVNGSPEMGLMWTGMPSYAVIANDGTSKLARCCGYITIVPLMKGGIMVRSRRYTLSKGISGDNQFIEPEATASGTITVSITGKDRDGEVGPLTAGSQLLVCGLKKP